MQRVHEGGGTIRVVYLTNGDGYPEGVRVEEHHQSPTPADYRDYGRRREREARTSLNALNIGDYTMTFLSFPDGGLGKLMRTYWSERRAPYRSPYTRRDRPPASKVLIQATEFRGEDLTLELARIIGDFRPTMILSPRKEDQHVDHCAAWYFTADALSDVTRVDPEFSADLRHLHHPLLLVAVRRRRAAARSAAAPSRRRVRVAAPAADPGGSAREIGRDQTLPDADARHGVVSRRVRAIQRDLLAAGGRRVSSCPTGARSVTTPDALRFMTDAPRQRLDSLDVFRGMTIAAMILVSTPGSWAAVYRPLDHASWHGWTPTDLVFPFLLFAMGAAVPFALARRRGEPRVVRRHVLRRATLLFALGLVLNAIETPPPIHWATFRIPGVLQRIALVYLAVTWMTERLSIARTGGDRRSRRSPAIGRR